MEIDDWLKRHQKFAADSIFKICSCFEKRKRFDISFESYADDSNEMSSIFSLKIKKAVPKSCQVL